MKQEEQQPKPRYFRLLEKGEIIERGDLYYESEWKLYELAIGSSLTVSLPPSFRPVQVDEWIEYAKQRPTKEDFEPMGRIDVISLDGQLAHPIWSYQPQFDERNDLNIEVWRRVTPPQPAKPKSKVVELRKDSGLPLRNLTVKHDGTAQLDCGDTISAESIDEFIKARESVMAGKD